MISLVVQSLIRWVQWLDDLGMNFECASPCAAFCRDMQNFDGVYDAKIDLRTTPFFFRDMEVRPSAPLPLVADFPLSTPVR